MPKHLCTAWYSLDVLFTSSTIIHLCMISVDRYLAFSFPLRYGQTRGGCHFVLKVSLVWLLSACIACPLFFLLKTEREAGLYKGCGPESASFVVSATLASFYLPLAIMTVMYVLTVRALHRHHHIRYCARAGSSVRHTLSDRRVQAPCDERGSRDSRQGGRRRAVRRHKFPQNIYESADKREYKMTRLSGQQQQDNDLSANEHAVSKDNSASNDLSLSEDSLTVSVGESRPTTSRRIQRPARLQRQTTRIIDVAECSNGDRELIADMAGGGLSRDRRAQQSWRRGDSTRSLTPAERGRRAVKVLGILLLVFVACYLPFFATYTVYGTCPSCRHYISSPLLIAFEWLAYSGSMVNPVVYHFFNPDFRRAFHRIIFCRKHR